MEDMGRFRTAVARAAGRQADPAAVAECRECAERLGVRTVVLVEGRSDQAALEALAARHGRDLDAEGSPVVPLGGVTNVGRHLRILGPGGLGLGVAGLYDAAEHHHVLRGLEQAGLAPGSGCATEEANGKAVEPRTAAPAASAPAPAASAPAASVPGALAGAHADQSRAVLERLGFHVCVADLEDELIRALGADAVQAVIAAQDEWRAFRTFRQQPAQQERTVEQQLHRFMGTHSGRKSRYAHLLVHHLDLARTPEPLARLLARTAG
ncbi:TOPRIM nucleotidyl transferase/hydrolase domain-containing protein [Streptomyces sp. NRRL S-118]|uniref:TOPRIM nucleotidyl transferase/hydrolase domain-containing protein n=1 Tax=Streptomyces sp. NRRL S-118 TaxID=1463881 RepID=UPI0005870CB1|nr:TOPRIM nucleotidyl transferase/hydrolase domain-containing protein [Streptomyces sp. NRRL S-118]